MNTYADKTQENNSRSVESNGSNRSEATFQFTDNRPEAIVQRKIQDLANCSPQANKTTQLQTLANDSVLQQDRQPIQKKENNTGLPDTLKTGIENLSGYSMDDVKVHYNSNKPAQLQAHAYAQGTDIHLSTGQEKHLPHEAWHVVQQKQGRVKPTTQFKDKINVNDDRGLEKEADVMGAKASLNHTWHSPSQLKSKQVDGAALAVQRTAIPAEVIWDRTHVVKEMNQSLFGSGDYLQGEIGTTGELVAGQIIVVNDADIFISRRGANQENSTIRDAQRNTSPSFKWIRVLNINNRNVTGLNVYVRAETVRIVRDQHDQKSSSRRREVQISEVDGWNESGMNLAVQTMHDEWLALGGDRSKSKTVDQCSGDTWNQNDEGVDVAHDLLCEEDRGLGDNGDEYQKTFIAHYEGDIEPIAVMILEMRTQERSSEKYLYLRWLLGSPNRKGGGSKLIEKAKDEAMRAAKGKLFVDSARSAEGWYQRQGFQTRANSRHNTLQECGCKFMQMGL